MISSVSAVTTDTSQADAAMKSSAGLNKDDFLQLFITQLQNQDPLQPQDSSQFIAQLAQLTQVEQAYNTNTNLQGLIDATNSNASLSAVSFIGKSITATGSQVNLTPGTPVTLGYQLASSAGQAVVQISDASGNTVRTLTGAPAVAGMNSVTWDGTDGNGNALPAGTYSFAVQGVNADGSTINGTPYVSGKVDGVNVNGTTPVLSVGGVQVPISSVQTVTGGA